MMLLIAPLEALTDALLTDPERRVLLALFSYRGKNTDTVWPSVESLSKRANIKDKTRVSKLTKSLANKGWLTKKKRGFTGGNVYTLIVPERLERGVECGASNLDSDANLDTDAKLVADANSNLDSDTNSNLDSAAKNKEQTIEHTNEEGGAKRKRFIPPTIDQVAEYCRERGNSIDAEHFVDKNQAAGWMLNGGKKIKDWKAVVRTWERNAKQWAADRGDGLGEEHII
jgi:hypothetical protein